jgi:hypothetical protein
LEIGKSPGSQMSWVRWVGVIAISFFARNCWVRTECVTGPCHVNAAWSVLTKIRGDVFARFHAIAAKVTVDPGIRSLACWNRCFALPQLLYRWRHQSGTFWIPPRTITEWQVW